MLKTVEVINYLKGSCKTLDEACNACGIEFEDLNHEHLDSEIFQCWSCGWWYEIGELSDMEDQICKECANE